MFRILWSEYGQLLHEARLIRTAVFVEEQGFQEEFDSSDESSYHLVIFDNDMPVATGRLLVSREAAGDRCRLGRIAVIKPERGKNIGFLVMNALEDKARGLGAAELTLGAQKQAEGFYRKAGYKAYGEEYLEEGCPHVNMKKNIEK